MSETKSDIITVIPLAIEKRDKISTYGMPCYDRTVYPKVD
jgi:hypothetical protein